MIRVVGIAHRDPGHPIGEHVAEDLAWPVPVSERARRTELPGALLLVAGDGVSVEQSERGWTVADLESTNLVELAGHSGSGQAPALLVQQLYEREGPAFLSRLRSAFAIVLWDTRERRLVLATDGFGIRRLYYAMTSAGVAFGSRAGDAIAMAGVDREVEPDAVYGYLNFDTVPAPQSIYRAVRRLPPGHFMVWQNGQGAVERYWDLAYHEQSMSRRVAAAQLSRHAEEAVGHALAGIEVKRAGAFLSGGTDSSTILGLMSRLTGERVNAFSIGFAEERYNELSYAELAARHFEATHYTKLVTPDDAFQCVPDLVDAYDEPFGNNSAIPTYLCARLARHSGVDVLLAGDGGDEIFGGNERYRREAILSRYALLPGFLRRGFVEPVLRALPPGGATLIGKAQRYVGRASLPNPERFYSTEFFFARERSRLLHPDFLVRVTPDWPHRVARRHYLASGAAAELNRLLYVDMKITLGDNDLFKVTRTAETAGVAVRFPMLDHALVEFTATLPAWHKVRGTEKRHLFKRAFAGLLPHEILTKVKHGFGLPISDWLGRHRGFRELARDTLLSRRSLERGYFAPGAVESLFRMHETDDTPFHGDLLWTILMLELWHRQHGDRHRARQQ